MIGAIILPQYVQVFSEQTIQSMKQYYASHITNTPQGAVFQAKTANAVITAYRSGKVLFQGASPEVEADKWLLNKDERTPKIENLKKKTHSYAPKEALFHAAHIGSDEAGTGDYFGPITVACTYVQPKDIPELKKMGVKDSKHLTDNIIVEIAKELAIRKIPYSLLVMRNEKYNRLQKQGWSQGKMKAMLHHHAIQSLLKKIGNAPLDGILIDQFCEPNVYFNHLRTENEFVNNQTYFMTKAESYSIAVAAGSIIARASFVREMDLLSEKLGIPLPKGASDKVDRTIATIIKNKSADTLHTCAKVHFANTKKATKYL